MMVRYGFAVHTPRDHGFLLERLAHWNTAGDGRLAGISGKVPVCSAVCYVDSIVLHATGFEDIPKANTCPLRAADGARGPLIARDAWAEFGAPVSAAFQLKLIGNVLELAAKIGNAECFGGGY